MTSKSNLQPWGTAGAPRPGPSFASVRNSNNTAETFCLPPTQYQYRNNRIAWPVNSSVGFRARSASMYWAGRDGGEDMFLPGNGFFGCRNNAEKPEQINCYFDANAFDSASVPTPASRAANSAYQKEWEKRIYAQPVRCPGKFPVARSRRLVVPKTTRSVLHYGQ